MKKLLYVLALILIAAGLQGYVETGASQPKEVALTDIQNLRDLPGADGCEPGTVKPSSVEGFPDTCVDATVYY